METPNQVITDSSSLFALIDSTDSTHRIAASVAASLVKLSIPIIIPAEVFSETINSLWKKISLGAAVEAGNYVLSDERFSVVETTGETRKAALAIFARQKSKLVSFTDCLVMTFADKFKTKVIFGFDESFRKNGYRRLGIDF